MSSETQPWRDEDVLRELYHEKEMTLEEVGNELGCSSTTVKNWLDKLGAGTRSVQEVRKKEWLSKPVGMGINNSGYEVFRPQWENERDEFYHHRLIAVAIYGIEEVKEKEVHHKSGVEWDNRRSNIQLVSSAEHREKHEEELVESRGGGIPEGVCDTFREEYSEKSGKELAEEYDTTQSTVSYHATGACRH